MATILAYWGVLAQNMNGTQKSTLVSAFQGVGENSSSQPSRRNHSRIRLDNNAILFQAAFDDSVLTIPAVKTFLANTFSISAALISHSVNSTVYGDTVTFTYLSLDRLTMICFGMSGGTWPSLATSRSAAQAYLAANSAAWESN